MKNFTRLVRDESRTVATSKMEHFVIILDVAAVLDPSLVQHFSSSSKDYFSHIMWVHQQQGHDRLLNISRVDHLDQKHNLNSRHYVKQSIIRVSFDPFRYKELYRILPHRGDHRSRKNLYCGIFYRVKFSKSVNALFLKNKWQRKHYLFILFQIFNNI